VNEIPLTIEDLMAQNKGRRLYRITITSSRTSGIFWHYDELCKDAEDAAREADKLRAKDHSDIRSSWHGIVTGVQELGWSDEL
jgi:hypothetical protein